MASSLIVRQSPSLRRYCKSDIAFIETIGMVRLEVRRCEIEIDYSCFTSFAMEQVSARMNSRRKFPGNESNIKVLRVEKAIRGPDPVSYSLV